MSFPTAEISVFVGPGGVGKTTLAAAIAARLARRGERTLVMTFDPSLRLGQALGIAGEAGEREVPVPGVDGLHASLLDPKETFDRLIARYAPDEAARRRILENPYYAGLSGSLAGILEYMAVERLYEVAADGRYERLVLDTPPLKQALDFLEAPRRVVEFLDSGVLKLALRPWFDARGRFRPAARWGPVGRGLAQWVDRVVGLDLLRDMAEFFRAFEPLFEGFRRRALAVDELLTSDRTLFTIVAAPSEERAADVLYLARALDERGCALGCTLVNRVHPAAADPSRGDLMDWLAAADARGTARLRGLLPGLPLGAVGLLPSPPRDAADLERLAEAVEAALS